MQQRWVQTGPGIENRQELDDCKWVVRFDLAKAKVLSKFVYSEKENSSDNNLPRLIGVRGIMIRHRQIYQNGDEPTDGLELWASNGVSFACYRDMNGFARDLPEEGIIVYWPKSFNRPNKGAVIATPLGLEGRYGDSKPILVENETHVYENNTKPSGVGLSKRFPPPDMLFEDIDFSNYRLGLVNHINSELLRLFMPNRIRGFRESDGIRNIDFWTYKGTEYAGYESDIRPLILITYRDNPDFIGGIMPTADGLPARMPDWIVKKEWEKYLQEE